MKNLTLKDIHDVRVAVGKAVTAIRYDGSDLDDFDDKEIDTIALAFYLDPTAEVTPDDED